MSSKQKPSRTSKRLKQTTLLGLTEARSSSTNTSKHTSKPQTTTPIKRRRVAKRVAEQSESEDDDSDFQSNKLQRKAQQANSSSDDEISAVQPVNKRQKVVEVVIDREPGPSSRRAPKTRQKAKDQPKEKGTIGKPQLPKKRVTRRKSEPESVSESDEVEQKHVLSTRLRTRDRKTAFQKNLERLKRRKQGKPSLTPSSSEDDSDMSEDEPDTFKGAKPTSDKDSLFDEDSESSSSSNFIVEDDDGALAQLPLEFSMESHQDLSHQFKKIFQFFVHIAVMPAKERHDYMDRQYKNEEYFRVPLQIARRKLLGLRDSLVASSVWRPEFKNALEKRPDFSLVSLDFGVPSCDACNLGGRLSTLIGRLSGFPYDKLGFEILDDSDSDSSSDSSSSKGSSNKNDNSEMIEYHLGRFCAKRTRVYHEYSHWEYSLFKCIRQEVDDLHAARQSKGFFRMSYAEGRRPPKDLSDADGICDWLDDRKIIDMEWKKMKDLMESARHLEMAGKKGEADYD